MGSHAQESMRGSDAPRAGQIGPSERRHAESDMTDGYQPSVMSGHNIL